MLMFKYVHCEAQKLEVTIICWKFTYTVHLFLPDDVLTFFVVERFRVCSPIKRDVRILFWDWG